MEKFVPLLMLIAYVNCAAAVTSCTSPGKFIGDSSCTGYVVCAQSENQLFTSYAIPCPEGFNIRYQDMVCTNTGNNCDPSYTCNNLGNFANPAGVSKTSYISCIQGVGDMLIALNMECPQPLEFDAVSGSCVLNDIQNSAQPDVTTGTSTGAIAADVTTSASTIANAAGVTSDAPTVANAASVTPGANAPSATPTAATDANAPSATPTANAASATTIKTHTEVITEVNPVFTTTTRKIEPRAPSNSNNIFASYLTVFAAIIFFFALL